MKNKKLSFSLMPLLIGIIMLFAFMPDAILFISGKKIDLNTAKQSEFSGKAAVEGEIFYPVECFAIYEETRTNYGIPTGKTETYYYLVANFNEDMLTKYWEDDTDFEEYYVVFSTTNKTLKSKLDGLISEWNIFFENGESLADLPNSIQIDGKLAAQPSDDDYIKYRDECCDYWEISSADVAEKRIVDSKITGLALVLTIIGFALIALGAYLIFRLIKGSRRPKDDDFDSFDDTSDSSSGSSDAYPLPSAPVQQDMNDMGSADELRQLRAKLNTGEITQDEYDAKLRELLK
ncbi:MAG: SHOCT domain-containing protein [Ruminococcus sp.]|nr:SHOCT domain-containing protein [Ruminococcus sp.]